MSRIPLVMLLVLASAASSAAVASARDRDGLPDRWERRHGLSTVKFNAFRDPDRDRLSNRREFRLRTHPRRRDTDRDGLNDGREVRKHKTNPRRRDTDRDGLNDRLEIRRYKTNPRRRDTDRDGFGDGAEVRAGTNPRDANSKPATPSGGSSVPPPSNPSPRGPVGPQETTVPCSVSASSGNLGVVLSGAAPGAVICLASGDYGSFSGANKAGLVTIREAPGASATIRLSMSSANNIVVDGLTIGGGSVSGSSRNVTIRNSVFTSQVTVNGTAAGANIVFEMNSHNNISGNSTANRFLAQGGGLTIRNSLLQGGGSDGVRIATSQTVVVEDNTFLDIRHDGSGNHTDMIQWYGGSNAIVRRNLFKQTASVGGDTQVMGAFDSTSGNLIEDNVIDVLSRNWCVEIYSGDGDIVRHNTCVYRPGPPCGFGDPCGQISFSAKSGDDNGRNLRVYDNIATSIGVNSSTVVERHHNMLRSGASGSDFTGTPQFVGGANPTTWEGYRLAPGSPGKGAASDGLDVGARF